MPLTTEQLVSILTDNASPEAKQALDYVNRTPGLTSAHRQQILNSVQAPKAPAAAPSAPPAAPPSPFLNMKAPGELNIPYGADYLDPTLNAYLSLAGMAQQDKQFQSNSLLQAALALAGLRAQGPASAAELAFLQAGMGFPAIGGSTAAIEDLVGASTRRASAPATQVDVGGQSVSTPQTLSGQQLNALEGNPNLAGVLQSFATAGGNPDLFKRSIAALVPANYSGYGSGLF